MNKNMIWAGFVILVVLAGGCSSIKEGEKLIGGQKDEHGCLIAAGYSWCEAKQECLRTWEEPCSEGKVCTEDAKICDDGSAVSRNPDLNCEFNPCPEMKACTADAKLCPDGSAVGRTGPNCEFAACPQ